MSVWRRVAMLGVAAAAVLVFVLAGGFDDGQSGNDEERTNTQETVVNGQPGAGADQPLSDLEERGRTLFVDRCGACHTFDAAGTQGAVGPSLDEAQVDEAEVLQAIEQGGREPGGPMPQNLVTGEDARAVAKFVAASGPGV